MDSVFRDLQNQGHNKVEYLVKWMEESRLVMNSEEGKREAREIFDLFDANNDYLDLPRHDSSPVERVEQRTDSATSERLISFEIFHQAIIKLARNHQRSFEEFAAKLAKAGPRFLQALKIGFPAITDVPKCYNDAKARK